MSDWEIRQGDVLERLREMPSESVHMCVTSPPYWGLRTYGVEGQLGLEPTPAEFVANMVAVFEEVRRVLRRDGTCWLNIGDSYIGSWGNYGSRDGKQRLSSTEHLVRPAWEGRQGERTAASMPQEGLKPKDLAMIPARLALALQDDGWWIRSQIPWIKGNPMPESVQDRPSSATEYVYLLTKSPRYYFDLEAGRVLSNRLNRITRPDEVILKGGRPAARSITTERSKVTLNNDWSPYLILSTLLTMKRILVKEGHDDLSKLLDVLNFPEQGGITVLAEALSQYAPDILVDILKHIGVIISKHDSNVQSKLWVDIAAFPACPGAVHDAECAFTVEQAREVIAKVIANAQLIRDAIPLDTLTEGRVDVNMVSKAVTLFECTDLHTKHLGGGLVTEALLQQLDSARRTHVLKNTLPTGNHNLSFIDGGLPTHYNTEPPDAQNGHNVWNWWFINATGYSEAHFATFPELLPEACITLGTSAHGVCGECGAPWKRVTERSVSFESGSGKAGNKPNGKHEGSHQADSGTYDIRMGPVVSTETLGWQPTCPHTSAPIVPATVLDPFSGSGTTGLVALRLGRRYVGIELNPEYVEMSKRRIINDAPLLNMPMEPTGQAVSSR